VVYRDHGDPVGQFERFDPTVARLDIGCDENARSSALVTIDIAATSGSRS
jgi:hypothetical protein